MKNNFLIALLCLAGSLSLSAQIQYNYEQDNFLRLELDRPVFNDLFGTAGINFFSFAAYLNGEFNIGESGKIAFEIPYFRTSAESFGSSSDLGNIAIAYQFRNFGTPDFLELKLRIPTAGEDNFGPILSLVDYTERFSAIVPDLISFEPSYNLESKNKDGFYYRFRPGLKFLIPTDDNNFDDAFELLLDLNIYGGYRTGNIDINAGITSTSILSEGDLDFDERVLRQFSSTITYTTGAFKPGVIFRVPLGDEIISDLYNIAIGVHFSYIFGGRSNFTPDSDSN